MANSLRDAHVLLVGAGGLGCAAGRVLAQSGVARLDIADDDVVDLSNLQRQILYRESDIRRPKAEVAAERLTLDSVLPPGEFRPVAREIRIDADTARSLVGDYQLVVEGSDNFATKFAVADACSLAKIPLIQAGAVRWGGWALASVPPTSACLRCVFEGTPSGRQATCDGAGVVGGVVGVLGALQAALALRVLAGDASAGGELWSYEGRGGRLRRRRLARQPHCPLCTANGTSRSGAPPVRAA